MKVQFVDLKRQNKYLKKAVMSVIGNRIDEAEFIFGKPLDTFEKAFSTFCGKKYTVGLNSGTDALKLALMAHGIGKSDEVITVPNSYFSTAMVVSDIGATPVFVDIDEDTYTMDSSLIEKAITKKTRAIIPVHLYGQPADMDPILKIAKKYDLIVIEDASQAHGAKYRGKKIPVGHTGTFSFYPSKNLGCFGDGGALVTDDKVVFENVVKLRNDGAIGKYIHESIGIKSRLDTLQAAILQVKLPYLRSWNEKRRKHARTYTKLLKRVPQIKTPKESKNSYHVFHIYCIEYKNRDELKNFLLQNGIEVGIHYPIPIHLQGAYERSGYKKGDFIKTEEKADTILSLPMFPEMTDKEIHYVCEKIKQFVSADIL